METVSLGGQLEGRVVEGRFPLLECLSASGNCSSFLTVLQGLQEAVIQLISTDRAEADECIAQWDFAMALSHPHLTRVFAAGRCVIDGNDVVYVVTERSYATLSKIIRGRTPKVGTAREIFNPILSALSYLHQNGVVHGYINPSNILLANMEPKLSGANFLMAGSVTRRIPGSGDYDAPELSYGVVTGAADIWSVGMTLWEAMTQTLPRWDASTHAEPVVTESLPNPLREIVQDCLRVDPLKRCTIQSIMERLDQSKSISLSDVPIPVEIDLHPGAAVPIPDEPDPLSSPEENFETLEPQESVHFSRSFSHLDETQTSRSWVVPSIVVLLAIVAFLSVLWVRGHDKKPPSAITSQNATAPVNPEAQEQPGISAPPAAKPAEFETSQPESKSQPDAPAQTESQTAPLTNDQPVPQSPSVADQALPEKNSKGLVARRVLPTVSNGARSDMRVPVEVILRVLVNQDGEVSEAAYVSPGPGNYFARQAQRAAQTWEFTPPIRNGEPERSVWTLRFYFDREKIEVTATQDNK